jgi:hypothetical protein
MPARILAELIAVAKVPQFGYFGKMFNSMSASASFFDLER